MSAITYPPGVLTGRPLEMFEVSLCSGPNGSIDLFAVPEQWSTEGYDGGRPTCDKDAELLQELCDATEDHYQRIDEEMEQIEGELNWIAPLVVAPRDGGCWFSLDEDPGITRLGGEIIKKPRCSWDIEDALTQFDEDWEYEQWINSPEYISSLKDINLHKLLSWDKSSESMHPQWAGSMTGDLDEDGIIFGPDTFLGGLYLKDRYDVEVEIVTHHPADKKGYAKGTTDYGDVYIPFKFRKYLPSIGDRTKMTIALQDVGGDGKKANGFRWTSIYQHNPTYR